MEQFEFFDIPSPCCGVCQSNNKGYCKGCLRSRDERLYWLKMSNTEKKMVLQLCARRKKAVIARALKAQKLASESMLVSPEQLTILDEI